MADVFLSYCSSDVDTANALLRALEREGLTVWIAPRDVPPGINYGAAINKGLSDSRALALLFSRDAVRSASVERELTLACELGMPIFPLRTDDTRIDQTSSFGYFLAGTQWVSISEGTSIPEAAGIIGRALAVEPSGGLRQEELAPIVNRAPNLRHQPTSALVDLGIHLAEYVGSYQLPAPLGQVMRDGLLGPIGSLLVGIGQGPLSEPALQGQLDEAIKGDAGLAALSWYPQANSNDHGWFMAAQLLLPLSMMVSRREDSERLLRTLNRYLLETDLNDADVTRLQADIADSVATYEGDGKGFLLYSLARMKRAAR